MLGAIVGDIVGSYYEAFEIKQTDFPLFNEYSRFTDDTVLTVAVADWVLNGGELVDYFHNYYEAYPNAVYGSSFRRWAIEKSRQSYNSWGNGAAMRVSPVGFAYDSLDIVLAKAQETSQVTHNHEEAIRGAQATASAIFLARNQRDKSEIKNYVETTFGYDLNRKLADIRPDYKFDVSSQGSVPESIIAFLESENYEGAIRNAVSLGGDADTMACIAGGIAEAYYGEVPNAILQQALVLLDEGLKSIIDSFTIKFLGSREPESSV